MAVKNANMPVDDGNDSKKKDKAGKKKKGGFLKAFFIFMLLLVVGAGVAVLGFNVLGLRDKYVAGALQNVPFVSGLLPQTDTSVDPKATPSDPNTALSKADLLKKIDQLTADLNNSKNTVKSLTDKNAAYVTQLQALQEVEARQLQFKQEKAEFDKMIAEKDPNAYAAFYKSIDPENAAVLYQKAVASTAQSKEVKDYVSKFTSMDEGSAAKIFNEMSTTDLNLVVTILKGMDSQSAGAIMAAMDSKKAASVAKKMSPS